MADENDVGMNDKNVAQIDVSTIEKYILSESGFLQDGWRCDVLERALATSCGIGFCGGEVQGA